MPVYSEKVMEHFTNPRNVGEIEDPDGVGEEGNPVCGDMMTFYIKVKDNRLEDVKFKTFGCGAAIAVSSMVSEMAKGKTLEEAMKITPRSVADELEGLPKNKFHCSNLGAQALHKAIQDYRDRRNKGGKDNDR
ncbi:MAG: Fe-S cluster assembly scaffold protein NifU [Dehalococcoidia bacterium]